MVLWLQAGKRGFAVKHLNKNEKKHHPNISQELWWHTKTNIQLKKTHPNGQLGRFYCSFNMFETNKNDIYFNRHWSVKKWILQMPQSLNLFFFIFDDVCDAFGDPGFVSCCYSLVDFLGKMLLVLQHVTVKCPRSDTGLAWHWRSLIPTPFIVEFWSGPALWQTPAVCPQKRKKTLYTLHSLYMSTP